MLKVISLTALILATLIGAGITSGKEIVAYFTNFGYISIIFSAIVSCAFAILCYICLRVGQKGYKLNNKFMLFFGIANFIVVSGMLAGSVSVGKILGFHNFVLPLATMAIGYFVVLIGLKGMGIVNVIIIPFVIAVILFICFYSYKDSSTIIDYTITINNTIGGIVSTINYFLFNGALVGVFLLKIGKNYSTKCIVLSCIIVAVIVCIVLISINLCVLKNNSVLSSDMPLLELSKNISNGASKLSGITIWCGLLSTMFSCLFSIKSQLAVSKYLPIKLLCIIIFAFGCAMAGFSYIVVYCYPLISILGLLFMDTITYEYSRIISHDSCKHVFR